MRAVMFGLALLFLVNCPVLKFVGAQTKKAAEAGVVEIGEGKDGKFRFSIRDDEGKLLAMSSPSGFASFKEAEEAVSRLKAILPKAKVVTKQAAKDKKAKDKKGSR